MGDLSSLMVQVKQGLRDWFDPTYALCTIRLAANRTIISRQQPVPLTHLNAVGMNGWSEVPIIGLIDKTLPRDCRSGKDAGVVNTRKIFSLAIILSCCTALLPQPVFGAQTVPSLESILRRYYDAMGGLSSINKIETLRIEGTVENDDTLLRMVIIKKRPDRVRLHFIAASTQIVQGYDGTSAWWILPNRKWSQSEDMPAHIAKNFIRDAPIESALVRYKEKNIDLVSKGIVMLPGNIRTLLLTARYPDGDETDFYLDADAYVERKIVTRNLQPDGSVTEHISIPSDYRRVNEVLVAYHVVNYVGNVKESTIKITNVRMNVGALDTLFQKPPADTKPAVKQP